MYPNTEEGHIN